MRRSRSALRWIVITPCRLLQRRALPPLQPLMGGNPSAEDVERVHDLKKQYYAANMDIARKNEALFVILGSAPDPLRP